MRVGRIVVGAIEGAAGGLGVLVIGLGSLVLFAVVAPPLAVLLIVAAPVAAALLLAWLIHPPQRAR